MMAAVDGVEPRLRKRVAGGPVVPIAGRIVAVDINEDKFELATQLGARPEPFILAVIFGANMSFATPYGYQTNLLILSAGGYKFSDFLRVGIPLTIVMWLGFSFVLPALYQL